MLEVLAAFVLLVLVAWMVLQPLLGRTDRHADAEVVDAAADAEEVVDLEAMIAERRRRMAATDREVER
ncbi:MAG: hypothetical protein ACNA8R_03645 [Nitriliruptoraceae bacterium]